MSERYLGLELGLCSITTIVFSYRTSTTCLHANAETHQHAESLTGAPTDARSDVQFAERAVERNIRVHTFFGRPQHTGVASKPLRTGSKDIPITVGDVR